MLDIEKDTATRIIDTLAVAIDGKPSSAKSFNQFPYEDLADYGNWGQDNNDSKRDTYPGENDLRCLPSLVGGRYRTVRYRIVLRR